MNPDKTIIISQQKVIDELKAENLELKCKLYDVEVNLNTCEAEVTYWYETAEYYKNKLKEIRKISNKTLDK